MLLLFTLYIIVMTLTLSVSFSATIKIQLFLKITENFHFNKQNTFQIIRRNLKKKQIKSKFRDFIDYYFFSFE